MPDANTHRHGRTRRAAKRRAGTFAPQSDSDQTRAALAPEAPPQSPLDFAQSVFRDPALPMQLRASMAKAALPYTHGRRPPLAPDPRDAAPEVPWPFNLPDPYGALRVDWRDALEQAGLIPPAPTFAHTDVWSTRRPQNSIQSESGASPLQSETGEKSVPRTMADVTIRQRRARVDASQDTPQDTSQEIREQRIALDPHDPHPGYRWI